MLGLISLFILVAAFLTTARVASIALETTGMARDSAQFQARSAVMGVGFTTSEAEDITSHPQRRRIVLWLMTFGNAGVITGIASLLIAFLDTGTSQTLIRTTALIAGTTALLAAAHTDPASRAIDGLARTALRRFTTLDTRDFAALLQFTADFEIAELVARSNEWMVGRPLSDLHLTREGIVVLGIHRSDGSFSGTPTGETTIQPGDTVVAYGRSSVLSGLATRSASSGDADHAEATAQHQQLLRSGM